MLSAFSENPSLCERGFTSLGWDWVFLLILPIISTDDNKYKLEVGKANETVS